MVGFSANTLTQWFYWIFKNREYAGQVAIVADGHSSPTWQVKASECVHWQVGRASLNRSHAGLHLC
jgi:hypothetical protein